MSTASTAYDKAKWHYDGEFPKDLPRENGATHIGIFLAWIIHRHLEGKLHHESARDEKALEAVRNRLITGRDFLISQCDEALLREDLNDEANRFAAWYYELKQEGRSRYFIDYDKILGARHPSLYQVEDTWANFDRIAPVIDRRFAEWKRGLDPSPRT